MCREPVLGSLTRWSSYGGKCEKDFSKKHYNIVEMINTCIFHIRVNCTTSESGNVEKDWTGLLSAESDRIKLSFGNANTSRLNLFVVVALPVEDQV